MAQLQGDLHKQQLITQTVTEANIKIKEDLEALKERLDVITRSRRELDGVMDRLFEDPQVQQMLRNKIKELKI